MSTYRRSAELPQSFTHLLIQKYALNSGCPNQIGTGAWKVRVTEVSPETSPTALLPKGIKRGYAVVNTDMGMATPPGQDASVFIGRPQRWKDWGYRSTHEMTVEAKRLVNTFYKRPATHNYFVGCSTGGEQGWMEAQRYPDDYDGIVSGAPANNRTGVHESILWNFVSMERTPEDHLSTAKLRSLAKAVMDACDQLDGVADDIISDPTKCSFDPDLIACSGSENDKCLTPSQVAVVRRLYTGPVDPRTGKQIYAGMPKGSELGWDHLGPSGNGQPPFAPIFTWVFGHDWNWRSFDFHRSVTAVDEKLADDLKCNESKPRCFPRSRAQAARLSRLV